MRTSAGKSTNLTSRINDMTTQTHTHTVDRPQRARLPIPLIVTLPSCLWSLAGFFYLSPVLAFKFSSRWKFSTLKPTFSRFSLGKPQCSSYHPVENRTHESALSREKLRGCPILQCSTVEHTHFLECPIKRVKGSSAIQQFSRSYPRLKILCGKVCSIIEPELT